MDAQQIEPRQQAAEHGAGGVAAVQQAHPGNALRVVSSHRDAAGSDAPISIVGGSRQAARTTARSNMAGKPWPTAAM